MIINTKKSATIIMVTLLRNLLLINYCLPETATSREIFATRP